MPTHLARYCTATLAVLTLSTAARGEVEQGTLEIMRVSDSAVIGTALTTGITPPTGYASNRSYWNWYEEAPPLYDFYLAAGSWTGTPSSPKYVAQGFTGSATINIPTSIGDKDGFYKLWVCAANLTGCTWVGGMWAEADSGTLHWYLRDNYAGDVFAWTSSQVLLFDHLATLPTWHQSFRYLEEDPV